MSKTNNTPAVAQGAEVKKAENIENPSLSQRFTEKVLREINPDSSVNQISTHQKRIIQHSYVKLDIILKENEVKREAKRDGNTILPFKWENVNMDKLAQDIASTSSVGLDPLEKNHLNLVPYINNKTGKYDITPIIGYRGTELKALKFGLNIPSDIVVELVYEKDTFKTIKKDKNNPYETYIFEESDDFDRGDVIGGFYYHEYEDNPKKNRVVRMSLAEILKRKPDYASAEFWGGIKDEWVNGQKTGQKITVDGWFEQMCWKTVFRAAHESITIDSEKISMHLANVMRMEEAYFYDKLPESSSDAMDKEVEVKAASKTINIDNIQGHPKSAMDAAVDAKSSGEIPVVDVDPGKDGVLF